MRFMSYEVCPGRRSPTTRLGRNQITLVWTSGTSGLTGTAALLLTRTNSILPTCQGTNPPTYIHRAEVDGAIDDWRDCLLPPLRLRIRATSTLGHICQSIHDGERKGKT
jgi:hypothetical protein